MFNFVNTHKRLIQGILFLIFLPFAFFGIESYFQFGGSSQTVASVGDYRITQQEFSQALRERQEALQRAAQGRIDPEALDNPELRYGILEGLIQRQLLLDRALRGRMTVSDAQLQGVIGELPLFRDGTNKFSFARYEQYLKSEGMTPTLFEARLKQDLVLRQLSEGFGASSIVPRTVAERLSRLSEQQREVSYYTILPDRFAGQVKLDAEAARKYYDANQDEFRIPEQVRVEYVTLSLESLQTKIRIDPAEVRRAYDDRRSQYEAPESRRASHILVSADAAADGDARQKARAKAEGIYKQVMQKPASFPAVARQYSEDPGSAAKGGDLGFLSRGTMKDVPEFEDALFKLKPGEISPPVESRLGFHIIRLTEIQPARVRPFEEVRGQIEQELGKQLAARKFAEVADGFNNVVYEQSESLKPAAELAGVAPLQSGWISRGQADNALLGNPRLLAAIFSEEVLKNKRNTEAIETAPGTLVAARVIEYKPASVQPFAEVQAAIGKKLVLREAARLAAQEGRSQLEQLRQGKGPQIAWSAPQLISRSEYRGLPEPVVRQAFRTDAARLPAYAGMGDPQGGYMLLRISRVTEADKIPPEKAKAFAEGLRQILGREELGAYIASLRQKTDIRISKEQLEKKQ